MKSSSNIVLFAIALCAPIMASANLETTQRYVGQTPDGVGCSLQIKHSITQTWVEHVAGGTITSSVPVIGPNVTEETIDQYDLTAVSGEDSIHVPVDAAAFAPILAGEKQLLKASTKWNEGVGKQSFTLKFASGKPVEADFRSKYLPWALNAHVVCENLAELP